MILVATCLASCSGGEDSAVESEGRASNAAATSVRSDSRGDSDPDSEADSEASVSSLDSRYVGPPYQFDAQALTIFSNVFREADLAGMQRVWGRLTPRQRLEAIHQARELAASEFRDASTDLGPAEALLSTVDYDAVVAAAEREEQADDPTLGALRGVVLERGTGAPVAGATLRATFGTESKADGRFEIRGLPPGSLALAVSKDGFKQHWHDVEIVANQTAAATVYLEALPATVPASGRGVLRGVIVDQETQEPIEGLELLVAFDGNAADLMLGKGNWSTVTNSDGVFEVANIPAGPVDLVGQKLPYFLNKEGVVIVALGVTEERIELSKLRGKIDLPVVVAGVVRDALTGEPVVEALVSAGRSTAVTSDGDGRYLIRLAQPGDLTLTARHSAYHEYSESLVAKKAGRFDRDILIRPITTGAVAGVAVDRTTGDPLGNAVISIAGQTLRTDAEGRFRVEELEAGAIAVQAAVDGYRPTRAEVALEARTTAETRLELDPITEGTVAGIVRDAATGRPLAGVRVTAGGSSAETGPEGRFALHDVPAGGQAIVARKAVYEPLSDTMEVIAAQEINLELALEPITYGTLTVIVRDATTGTFIADSRVSVGGKSAQTDDQGRASFERVPAGRVTASAARHAYQDGGATFTLEPAAAIDQTLRLEPATVGVVVGQVVSADSGEPLPGVEVAIGDQRASADSDGRFRFEGIDAGEATVTARKAVYEPRRETISVVAAESVEVRIALLPITYGTVVGVVVDAVSGQAIADAKVVVGALTTQTNAEGRFSIERVEAGRVLLSAAKRVYESQRKNLELAPAQTLEQRLALQPVTYGALTGRVIDVGTGAPLAGATVTVGGRNLTTGRDGRFELDRVEAGQIAVNATKDAYRPGSASVRLDPAGTAEAVVALEAIKVGTVVGVVRDARTGEPIAGARIAIGGQSLETDAQGRFRLGDIDAGAVSLGARHADYGDGTASGTVTGAGTLELDIRLDLRREDVTQLETALATAGTIDLYGIHFDSGDDQFKPSSLGTLNAVLEVMKRDPEQAFRIAGHTDSDGTEASNQDLSQRRARTVIGWLVEHGIETGRLQREGYGESRPAAPNDTVAGKALNRRVELSYAR
jgi:outer membrane protein OmpA-like peptidoglycan-associated protein